MVVSLDSRVWLATHLMYPNSSQAFDVYQTLVSQSQASIKKNNINDIFQKLYQIVSKIPAISSNKAFHVFDEDKTEQWRQIYKKSQKDQLIIFIGYFVFGLKLKEISNIIKLTPEKTQFLFHQTFKKATFSNIKVDVAEKVSFKKYNEERVSFLFTNENLIDFCLKILSPNEMKKVRLGLQTYPELQAAQKQYDLIVGQMQYLVDSQVNRVTKTLIETSETLSEPRETFQIAQVFAKNKIAIGVATLSIALLFVVLIRPSWIQNATKSNKDTFVDLQEIKPKDHIAEVHADTMEPVENKTTSTPVLVQVPASLDKTTSTVAVNVTKPTSTPAAQVTGDSTKPVAVAVAKPVVKPPIKPVPPVVEEDKKAGGLYRGVLVVTDINEVSSKITQRLVEFGGKKAGEVELGWKKTDKLAYYHFTLPENNVDAAKEFLSNFGTLQIQFENHPRLMPPGVKRLIIEVKERE
jgi:hypothetical protein